MNIRGTNFTYSRGIRLFLVIWYSPSAIVKGDRPRLWVWLTGKMIKMLPAKAESSRITTKQKTWQPNAGRYKLNWIKSKLQNRSYSKTTCWNIPCNFIEFEASFNIKRGCYVKIWVLFPRPKLDTNSRSFIIFERSLPGALTMLICPSGVEDHTILKGLCQRETESKGEDFPATMD